MHSCNHFHNLGATKACLKCGNCRPQQDPPRQYSSKRGAKYLALARVCHCTCPEFITSHQVEAPPTTGNHLVQLFISDMLAANPAGALPPLPNSPQLADSATEPHSVSATFIGRKIRHCHLTSPSVEGLWLTGHISHVEPPNTNPRQTLYHVNYDDNVERAPLTYPVVQRALLPEHPQPPPATSAPQARPHDMPHPMSLLHRTVTKQFFADTEDGALESFHGEVVEFNSPQENDEGKWLFEIRYEDNDSETVDWTELKRILVKRSNTKRTSRTKRSVCPEMTTSPLPSPPHFPSNPTQRLLTASIGGPNRTHTHPTPKSWSRSLPPATRLQGAPVLWAEGKSERVFTPNPSEALSRVCWHFPPSHRGQPTPLSTAQLLFRLAPTSAPDMSSTETHQGRWHPQPQHHHIPTNRQVARQQRQHDNSRHTASAPPEDVGVVESKHGSEEPEPHQPPATAPRTSSGVVRRPHSRTTSTRQRSAALRHSPLYVAHGEIAAGKNLLCLRADITPTFIRTDTPADGNCFFHGASMGLFGHWDHNHVLRNRVADEIEAHPARYQFFKPLNEHQLRKINLPRDHVSTFADLVRYSRTPGCWAFGPH